MTSRTEWFAVRTICESSVFFFWFGVGWGRGMPTGSSLHGWDGRPPTTHDDVERCNCQSCQ